MVLSLSELMNLALQEEQTKVIPLDEKEFVRVGTVYPIKDDNITVSLTNLGNKKVRVQANGNVTLVCPCDRCLTDVDVDIPIEKDEIVDFNETADDRIKDLNELSYINGYDLDVDHMVCEEILLGFPMKVLCQDDCKGICKVCGANLNQGECGCDRTEPDPRMSVIRDIFNNFKEV